MYAQLLMRAVTGSIYPHPAIGFSQHDNHAANPYDTEKRKLGQDWPSVGHTMVGWKRIENIYNVLSQCQKDQVPGDFVELGVWRGGASVFAAGIIKHFGLQRDVWLFDSFAGFDREPWDGDRSWVQFNRVIAVPVEEVQQTFENYALMGSNVHFVKGEMP